MTESTTKSTKSVAPETVRLFEIIGFGQTNEEEHKNKVKNIMEVTGCEQDIAILTLHDCNDETEAIQRLLDSNTGSTQEGWVIKKKTNKKKMVPDSVENGSPDAIKAYVTDGHSGESVVEGRRGAKSRERDRNSSGGGRDRKDPHKESEESWDGEEITETSIVRSFPQSERDRPVRNGFSNKPNRQRYSNENRHERREQDGDRNQDRQSSRVFRNRRNERYNQDEPKDRNDGFMRDDQNKERKNKPYRERKSYNRDGDDGNRTDRQWDKPKYNRDRNETGEHEQDDRSRDRKFGRKGTKRSDKEPIIFESANRSSKTTPDLNGDIYINSRHSVDAIDWENPILTNTDWGADDAKKRIDEDVDEDKRIEAILSEGWEFCNPNFDKEDVEVKASHPSKPNIESTSTSTSPHSQPIHDSSQPIFSPQTTSLPTPSASIPESGPPSHHQALWDMFNRSEKMNIKKKTRSRIPHAPVELPSGDLDTFDIQFGNVVTLLAPITVEAQDEYKFTESPSPVDENKQFSNANFQESDSPSNEQLPSPPAPKSNERPVLPKSPPPKNDHPISSRSPVPQDKQHSVSAAPPAPPSHQTAVPSPVTVPSHPQPHQQYHQHMNRQNERKYPENSGKMHHHGGMSVNPVKMQQHPQMAPVNSIDQQTGMPFLMTPMGSVGAPNSLPPTTMSNLPRGPGKNYQTPVIYNAPTGQFSMMPNYYFEQEMMRLMASQNSNPGSNMVKDQNSNQVFPNNDAKFHEPTSPANAQSGIQGQNVYLPFHGYGFFPNIFPMMPKGNAYPNPVTASGQTPFQTQPPMPPNIPALPDQHTEYKANFSNVQQKQAGINQAADLQNMYKGYDQKSAIPFGFGYPMAQYMTPQMLPPLSQQQPQYSNITPNMLLQQPLETQRPKW
ncbi:hypothetical protein LOD99_12793 [Oopsacas minuta]|uniref:Uncharacterized protein n=1 Tax=Oopsacas minuta TaxID=111878 RepID=A0AAV7JD17_9METZ|nr:hypothetical protein LOD99_12793 [Oopsacas minuta]